MAEEFKLNPDETVILRSEGVGYGNTFFGKNDELILTNQAILLQKKGMFGKTKGVLRFPLSGIRIVNGQIQALLGKKDIVTPSLDVYFESGSERFLFSWEDDVREWIDNINAVMTGKPIEKRGEYDDLMQDMEKLAAFAENVSGSVSHSIQKVKDALGIKSTEQLAKQCPSCGASVSGVRGEVAKCPYCGSFVKFM